MALNLQKLVITLAGCLAIASCGEETIEAPKAPDHISADALKSHVSVLAGDDLNGRDTGTKGYDTAAVYVAKQLQSKGYEPAGTNGTYFQPILFKDVRVIDKSAQVIVTSGAENGTLLQYVDDYYFILNPSIGRLNVSAPLVYADYGVTAPDYGLDSYNNIDMTGKIAVVLSGVPEGLPPEEGAVFSSLERKAEDARKAGAVGLAIIYAPKFEKVYPYTSRARRAVKGRIAWLDDAGAPYSSFGDLQTVIRFSPKAGALLFEGAEHSYEDVRQAADVGDPIPSFALPAQMTASYILEERSVVSSNIIARLPANAPKDDGAAQRSAEAVLLIAHLDHLGKGKAIDGDDIYNGAVDNALGVATIVEAAGAITKLPGVRTRDFYVAALTAEEHGLLGAEYLARHLPVAAADLEAVLNIDMPVALYPFATVQASGEVHSNLGALAGEAAQRYGLELEEDPMPEEAIFIRSDHYAFVERGIPSLYLNIGVVAAEGSDADGFAELDGFLMEHYHKPSDEIGLPINWAAAARFGDVHVEMLRTLLTTDLAIRWADNSFFNKQRAAD